MVGEGAGFVGRVEGVARQTQGNMRPVQTMKLLPVIMTLLCGSVMAETRYLSSSGDDAADGLTPPQVPRPHSAALEMLPTK